MFNSSQEKTAEDYMGAILLKTGDGGRVTSGGVCTTQSTGINSHAAKVRKVRSAQMLDSKDRRWQYGSHKQLRSVTR